jgi:dUTP pyrophosphatase
MESEFFEKYNPLLERYDRFMILNIYVDNDIELKNKYINDISIRNERIIGNDEFIDAGFDVFVPEYINIPENEKNNVFKLNHKIKCAAIMITRQRRFNSGFYLYPRSSISNTPYRLANSVGIIDSGYRGNIIAALDIINKDAILEIQQYSRLVQICAPGLVPVIANIVDNEADLGITPRGIGGFGSTGV